MDCDRSHRHGVALVAISALLWSTAGLFVRMADLDTWTIVTWRSIFASITLGAIALAKRRSRPQAAASLSWPAALSVVTSVVSTISYVLSLRLTTVANVMTIYAALPFVATAIAFVWRGERVTRRFLIAGAIALFGITIMAGAAASSRDMLGIVAAIVMTCGFATQLVHTKQHPALDMMLLTAIAAAVCVPLCEPLMVAGIPAPRQLLACALYGILTTGLGYVLALKGGRLISSGEAGFISMLDVVLGPLWVWLVYAERPTIAVVTGGLVVLCAVAWYLSTQYRRQAVRAIDI